MEENNGQQKLTDEELESIQNLKRSNQQLVMEFGQIEIAKRQLDQRIENANNTFDALVEKEKEIMEGFGNKYQDGSIDIESGVFTPTAESGGRQEDDKPITSFDGPIVKK